MYRIYIVNLLIYLYIIDSVEAGITSTTSIVSNNDKNLYNSWMYDMNLFLNMLLIYVTLWFVRHWL